MSNNISNYDELVRTAKSAKENAYVPYSDFKVGAAIRTSAGEIFTGCNIENASYGLTNCAERTAIFKAISEGIREIESLALVTENADTITPPCGACRQVMVEFNPEMTVILSNTDNDTELTSAGELLPHSFDQSFLSENDSESTTNTE